MNNGRERCRAAEAAWAPPRRANVEDGFSVAILSSWARVTPLAKTLGGWDRRHGSNQSRRRPAAPGRVHEDRCGPRSPTWERAGHGPRAPSSTSPTNKWPHGPRRLSAQRGPRGCASYAIHGKQAAARSSHIHTRMRGIRAQRDVSTSAVFQGRARRVHEALCRSISGRHVRMNNCVPRLDSTVCPQRRSGGTASYEALWQE